MAALTWGWHAVDALVGHLDDRPGAPLGGGASRWVLDLVIGVLALASIGGLHGNVAQAG
jgi:hypothetical protein